MNFDIIEVIKQMQRKQVRSISIENGDMVDISMSDGKVVVTPRVSPALGPGEDIDPAS